MPASATMRAFVLQGHGDLDQLAYHDDWPVPAPAPGQVLIAVGACGLNNTDVNTRSAWYSKSVDEATTGAGFADADAEDASWGGRSIVFPRIQGADVVGTVVAVNGAPDSLVGRRVLVDTWLRDWDAPLDLARTGYFGSECDGGYAEYTVVDHRQVHPIDSDFTDPELATFATAYITAENMLRRAAVAAGDTVLIPGASGGVGSALIQLTNRRGATAIAMCGEDKAAAVAEVGAAAVLPRSPGNLRAALRDVAELDAVNVVADVVGGALWPQMLDVIERGGRYTCAGAIAGPMVEFDLRTFYLRDLVMTGATVVPPGLFADLVGYIERAEVRPLLAATYPLEQLKTAQEAFIAKVHVGNIVVSVTPPSP
ncbi:MAG: zinc-binding dehydrogenase [Pseudomonadota bacterium]